MWWRLQNVLSIVFFAEFVEGDALSEAGFVRFAGFASFVGDDVVEKALVESDTWTDAFFAVVAGGVGKGFADWLESRVIEHLVLLDAQLRHESVGSLSSSSLGQERGWCIQDRCCGKSCESRCASRCTAREDSRMPLSRPCTCFWDDGGSGLYASSVCGSGGGVFSAPPSVWEKNFRQPSVRASESFLLKPSMPTSCWALAVVVVEIVGHSELGERGVLLVELYRFLAVFTDCNFLWHDYSHCLARSSQFSHTPGTILPMWTWKVLLSFVETMVLKGTPSSVLIRMEHTSQWMSSSLIFMLGSPVGWFSIFNAVFPPPLAVLTDDGHSCASNATSEKILVEVCLTDEHCVSQIVGIFAVANHPIAFVIHTSGRHTLS